MFLWTSTSKLPPVFGALASSATPTGQASSTTASKSGYAGMRLIMDPLGGKAHMIVSTPELRPGSVAPVLASPAIRSAHRDANPGTSGLGFSPLRAPADA